MTGKYVARMEVNGKVHYYSSRAGALDEVVFNAGAFESHNNITAGLSTCTNCFASDDSQFLESSTDHSLLVWMADDEINVGAFTGSTLDVVQSFAWDVDYCGIGETDTHLLVSCVSINTNVYWASIDKAAPGAAVTPTISNTAFGAIPLQYATSIHNDGTDTILCHANMPLEPSETGAVIVNSTYDIIFEHTQLDEATYGTAPECEIFTGGYSAAGDSVPAMMMTGGTDTRGNLVLYDTTDPDEVVRNHFYQDGLSIIMMESQNWYGSEGRGRIRSKVVPADVSAVGQQVTVHVTAGGDPLDGDHGRFAVNYKFGTGMNNNWNFPALINLQNEPEITDVDLDLQAPTTGDDVENPIVMTIKMPGKIMTTHLVVYQQTSAGVGDGSGSIDDGSSPLSGTTFLVIGGILASMVIILVFWGILKPTSDGGDAYKAADSSNDSKA